MWRRASKAPVEAASAEKPLRETLAEITATVARLVPADKLEPPLRAVQELRASGIVERMLAVGTFAPSFELPDQTGKTVRSAELLERGPVILNFFRGRWCPYCVAELEVWQGLLPEVEAAGASLVAISPQKQLHIEFTASQHKLTYPVLSDAGNAVARQFGLVWRVPEYLQEHYRRVFINLPNSNGDRSWELPVAATYVVGSAGLVVYAAGFADFRERPEPKEVLATVR